MDFSSIVSAVDFSAVGGAVFAIAQLMVAYYVVAWGARRILEFIDGGRSEQEFFAAYARGELVEGVDFFDVDGRSAVDHEALAADEEARYDALQAEVGVDAAARQASKDAEFDWNYSRSDHGV